MVIEIVHEHEMNVHLIKNEFLLVLRGCVTSNYKNGSNVTLGGGGALLIR